jgi:hypothetical protein
MGGATFAPYLFGGAMFPSRPSGRFDESVMAWVFFWRNKFFKVFYLSFKLLKTNTFLRDNCYKIV